MSTYDQHQATQVYPPPAAAYPPPGQAYPPHSYPPQTQGYPPAAYVAAPPPMGYPNKDGPDHYAQQPIPVETKSRGDGFWKGCCAAICCCCVLDVCF